MPDQRSRLGLDELMEISWSKIQEEARNDAVPTVVALNDDNALTILVLPWRSEQDKQSMLALVKWSFLAWGTTAYVVSSEAWAAYYGPETARPDVMPRDREDRRELIHCLGVNVEKRYMRWSADIIRGDDGKVTGYGPTQKEEGTIGPDSSHDGQMLRLLAPESVRREPKIRKLAQKFINEVNNKVMFNLAESGPGGEVRVNRDVLDELRDALKASTN